MHVASPDPPVPLIPDYRLSHCIGRGSFGEVWMAEGLTGVKRAIKILPKPAVGELPPVPAAASNEAAHSPNADRKGVSQASGAGPALLPNPDRKGAGQNPIPCSLKTPTERELSGIRQYQQLAKGHEHLIEVLHVGETADFYYYVMELADAAGASASKRYVGPLDRESLLGPTPAGIPSGQPIRTPTVGARHAVPLQPIQHSTGTPLAPPDSEPLPTFPRSHIPTSPAPPPDIPTSPLPLSHGGTAALGCDPYIPLTLKHLISTRAPLPPAQALDILAQILRGLDHLHRAGLVHRDVKPANILVVGGRFKLGDLGLVTSGDRDVTQIGTPGYMPPDARMDHTADLYAAGIILYEMITGLDRSKFPELPARRPKTRTEAREYRAAIGIANRAAHPNQVLHYSNARAMHHDAQRGPGIRAISTRSLSTAALALLGAIPILLAVRTALHPGEASVRILQIKAEPERIDRRSIEAWFSNGEHNTISLANSFHSGRLVDFDGGNGPAVVLGAIVDGGRAAEIRALDADALRSGKEPAKTLISDCPPSAWEQGERENRIVNAYPLLSCDLDGQKGEEVLVAIEHDSGAMQLVVFSTGLKRLGSYWHLGWGPWAVATESPSGVRVAVLLDAGERSELGPDVGIQYSAIMVLDAKTLVNNRDPNAFWTVNSWMNAKSNLPPWAYAHLTLAHRSRDNAWRLAGLEGCGGNCFRAWVGGASIDMTQELELTKVTGPHPQEGQRNLDLGWCRERWERTIVPHGQP